MEKQRNYSLDLLRIISMLMVVCIHYLGNGGLMGELELWEPNWFAGYLLHSSCMVAVNCFVLISGYFLCTSKFRLSKWVSLWVEALFYSVAIYLLLVALGVVPFSVGEFIKNGMVLTMRRYWFVTVYLAMYAVFPFLNCVISAMTQKQHFLCCGVLMLFLSVLPNVVFINDFLNVEQGFSLLWFCQLYLIAAYIRKYVSEDAVEIKKTAMVYAGCTLFMLAAQCGACLLTPKIFGYIVWSDIFYTYNSIPVAAGSIALFLTFRGMKIRGKWIGKIIRWAAPVSFSVYLLHHHSVGKTILWEWLGVIRFTHSFWMIPMALVVTVAIYVAAALVDYLRQWLFKICKINVLIEKTCEAIQEWTEKTLSRFAR